MLQYWVSLTFLTVVVQKSCVSGKSVVGTLSSLQAKDQNGQYLSTFNFNGEGSAIKYSLNTTGNNRPLLLFYRDDDWKQITESDHDECEAKIQHASITHTITNTTGNHSIPGFPRPQIWHVVYADEFTCQKNVVIEEANFISFHLQMLNPDVLGNPTVHFSDDETGLYRFYQLLALFFFVMGCIYGPHMYETSCQKEGPMTLVLQLLASTLGLHGSCAFLMMMHLRSYSKDGFGLPFFVFLAELLDVVSQALMLYMMLSLSLGRTFAGIYKPIKSFSKLQQEAATKAVTVMAVIQALLFIWDQYEESEHRMYLAARYSASGLLLAIIRIVLAAAVAGPQYIHVSSERSAMKKEFYIAFTKYCMVWFLCFPVCVLLTQIFSPYYRYKIITMGVVTSQTIAVIFIYRLFYSRSLYWEVSSLGSSVLPLRMDRLSGGKGSKSIGIKLYTS